VTASSGAAIDLITSTDFKGTIKNIIVNVPSLTFENGGTIFKLATTSTTDIDAIFNVSVFSASINITGLDIGSHIKVYNTASIDSYTDDVIPTGGLYVPWGNANGGGAKLFNCATSDTFANAGYTNITDCLNSIIYLVNYSTFTPKSKSSLRKAGKIIDAVTSDIFLNGRTYFDIGAIQTNIVDSGDLTDLWTDLKLFINAYTTYQSTMSSMVKALTANKLTTLTSGTERVTLLANCIDNDNSNVSTLNKMADTEVDNAESYIQKIMKSRLYSTESDAESLLGEFDYWHGINSQKIKGIDLAYVVKKIATGDGTLGSIVIPQLLAPQVIEIECTSATTAGSEKWSVTGSVSGSMDQATTNVSYVDADTKLAFKISVKSSVNWVVGDKIQIHIVAENSSVKQEFFRDNFEFVFSNNVTDGTQTISD
jgi:hypothetical protein